MVVDSSNNTVVWAWESDAFGVRQPSIQNIKFNLRFPGQYYDELTKQHYNHHRYYNPELGRYMEADPIGLEGGSNPYSYSHQNPIMFVDPTGAIPIPVLTGVIGGILGGGASLGVQIYNNKSFSRINWKDVGIATSVGAVAGAVSPWTASTTLGAVITGSVSNSISYGVTEVANNRKPTATGLTLSAGLGALGGKIAGPIQKAPIRISESPFISSQLATRSNRSQDWNYFLNNSSKFVGIGNVGGATIAANPFNMNSMNITLAQSELNYNQLNSFQVGNTKGDPTFWTGNYPSLHLEISKASPKY